MAWLSTTSRSGPFQNRRRLLWWHSDYSAWSESDVADGVHDLRYSIVCSVGGAVARRSML